MTVRAGSTGTESAERVADVLLAFSRGRRSFGVSELARQLSLSKAVIHRILQSLVSRSLLQFDAESREYSLGPGATALGGKAILQSDLRMMARDDLVELRDATGETTTLSLLVMDQRAYIDQYESPQEIKMTVELGRLYPLHAGASSRVILAHLPEIELSHVLEAGLPHLTAATISDVGELEDLLAVVRRDGYAVSRGERQSGAASVAAPVFGRGGRVVGSISICGPLARFGQDAVTQYAALAVDAANRISSKAPTQ